MPLTTKTTVFALAAFVPLALGACSGQVFVNDARDPGDAATSSPGDEAVAVGDDGLPTTCTDGVQNGLETAMDCGGGCPGCAVGQPCGEDGDCASGACVSGVCIAPACTDGRANGLETGVDCGGPFCPACGTSAGCTLPSDCTSGVCDPSTHTCAAPACDDGAQNGNETGVDCGGGCLGETPPKTCPVGVGCTSDDDCAGGDDARPVAGDQPGDGGEAGVVAFGIEGGQGARRSRSTRTEQGADGDADALRAEIESQDRSSTGVSGER